MSKTKTKIPAKARLSVKLLFFPALVLLFFSLSPLPQKLIGLLPMPLPIALPKLLIWQRGVVAVVVWVLLMAVAMRPVQLLRDKCRGSEWAPLGLPLLLCGWLAILLVTALALGWLMPPWNMPFPWLADGAEFLWQRGWLPNALTALNLTVLEMTPVMDKIAEYLGYGLALGLMLVAITGLVVLVRKLIRHLSTKPGTKPGQKSGTQTPPPTPPVTPPPVHTKRNDSPKGVSGMNTFEIGRANAQLEDHLRAVEPLDLDMCALRIRQPAVRGPQQEWLLTQWNELNELTFRSGKMELVFRREGKKVFLLGSEKLLLVPGVPYEVVADTPRPMQVMTITCIQ